MYSNGRFIRSGSEISQPDGADYRQRDRLWSNASEGGGGVDYQRPDKMDKLARIDAAEKSIFHSNQDLVVVQATLKQ
jgi:sugar lactone lactonase YvrE